MRPWAFQSSQPTYAPLAASEHNETGTRAERSMSGDSSGSIGGSTNSNTDVFYEKPMLSPGSGGLIHSLRLLPALLVRSAYLVYLMATEPLRRRTRHAESGCWPGMYVRLEEFKVLVPSFLQPKDPGTKKRLHPTAWLDGLRGIAAFFVVWHHSSLLFFGWHLHDGYGSSENEHWLMQLPFLRLAISGPPHVAIFFVISGYALSYKPLRLSRMGRYSEAAEAINSSVFRRHPRLFIAPAVTTFCAAVMTYYGLFGTKGWAEGVAMPAWSPHRADSLWGQMTDWAQHMKGLTDPFAKDLWRGGRFNYDRNLWTLPVEFDCSLVLFLCQAAFNRLRPGIRMAFMLFLVGFSQKYIFWQAFLFLSGMLLCDLHFHFAGLFPGSTTAATHSSTSTSASDSSHSSRMPRRWRTLAGIAGAIFCLYLLSTPESGRGGRTTPGYVTLYHWLPALHENNKKPDYFWVPIAAVLLVFCIDRTPALQRLFTHALPQYFGTISYSMYLVHGPLLFSLGHWLVRKTTAITGIETQMQYGLGITLASALLWVAIIFFADLVTRTVDARAVNLPRQLYDRFMQKDTAETILPRTA